MTARRGVRDAHGVPIDDADPPDWVHAHVTPDQLRLNRGLLWILVIYRCRGLDPSRYSVAQRLYIHTLGRDQKRANPSIRSLVSDLELSENTVTESIRDLEERGFLLVRRRGNARNTYILAWPLSDTTSPAEQVPLCGAPTAKGGICTRRAGRGTTTPGVGPCVQHGGTPRNPPPAPAPPQTVQHHPATPQPLRNPQHPHTSTIEEPHTSTVAASAPQPLRPDTSAAEAEYVRGASPTRSLGTKSPPLAAGERTVRNTRAREARARTDHSFAARLLITRIPRYRNAEPWVRKRLVNLAQAALDRRLGADAIRLYADKVIRERAHPDNRHIPEFVDAIQRLAADVAAGDVCPAHGLERCRDCTGSPNQSTQAQDADRPWSERDQADLEAALARLGVTPDQAAQLNPHGGQLEH